MTNWLSIDQYKKLYYFLGKKSVRTLFFGVFTGVSLFAIEVTFAYLLQAFLVVLKVVPSRTTMNFPSWLPIENTITFLIFVTVVLLGRGIVRWVHAVLIGVAYESQREFQRFRLIDWAFSAKSASASEVISLYTHSIESVSGTMVTLQNLAILLSTSILIFIYLLKISVFITCCSFAILALIAFVTRGLDLVIVNAGKKVNEEHVEIDRSLLSNLKNLLLLQIYGTQKEEKEKIKIRLKNVIQQVVKYHRVMHLKSALPQTLGMVLICSLCVISTKNSWIPSALMITYFYLFLQFVQNFSEVLKNVSSITFSLPATIKFAKWWADHAHDGIRNRQDDFSKQNQPVIRNAIGWEMDKVTFSYYGNTVPTLKEFSLKIEPLSCLVILGESGSGKSTILSLLLGLVEPNTGNLSVVLSNSEKKTMREVQASLLDVVGYVGPESFLVEGTIYDNLIYGLKTKPSPEDVRDALSTADCSFVNNLPNGLNHKITEQGQGLSAGQKQRLSFARAILRKPKVLILDEATSNLDMETEDKMVKVLSGFKKDMTIVAVTHREAMLKIADQVVRL